MSRIPGQRSLRDAAKASKPAASTDKQPARPLGKEIPAELLPATTPAKSAVCEKCVRRAETDRKQHEQAIAAKANRKARIAAKVAKNAERRARRKIPDRLPHDSRFTVSYHAGKQCWDGILAVPGFGQFYAEASAVFDLLPALDAKYREAKVAAANASSPDVTREDA